MFSLSPTVDSTLVLTGILDGNKRDERETFSSQLKNFRDNLTAKTGLWDELKEHYSKLRGTIYNLTQKMSQLEKDEDLLTAMTDNLTSEVVKMRDELQAKGKCSRNKLPALHYFDCVKLKNGEVASQVISLIFTVVAEGILCIVFPQTEARQCPASWTKFGRSCYFISTSEKSWHESNGICQRNQAHLVIVSSRLEQVSWYQTLPLTSYCQNQ